MAKRVALFMDYENFYTSLKERSGLNPYGTPPDLDFVQLVAYVEQNFGRLAPEDFIVAANFSHYNEQKGGLNKVATLMHLDSFKPHRLRQRDQPFAGLHHVLKNYVDMRLALEVGRHLAQRPADVYLIASGDGDFVAVAHAILEAGRRVYFLVPDSNKTAREIREQFAVHEAPMLWLPQEPETPQEPATDEETEAPDPVQTVCDLLGALRREFSAGIPLDLLKVLLPPEHATAWVNKAYGEGLLDFWNATNMPEVKCVSLRSARLQGKIIPMPTRPELARSGAVLQTLIQHSSSLPPSQAAWKRRIKSVLGLSSKQAKRLFDDLAASQMLDPAYPTRLQIDLERLQAFMRRQKDT